MKTFLTAVILFLVTVFFQPVCHAVDFNTISAIRVQSGIVTVEFANEPGVYYLLEHSSDLATWQPADMSLGVQSVMELAQGITKGFFRAMPISKYAPKDTDGDGIDDVYELQHPGILDPLNPSDGSHLAPGGGGRTNYQVYLGLFGITSYKILQREGREVSVFNFGSPSALFEANSREQSIFNFGSPSATVEANSREISLYNGQAVPLSDLLQIETREFSVFNFGSAPGGGTNSGGGDPGGSILIGYANSRELSIFNGQAVPPSDLLQIETREVSVFNFGSPTAPIEVISREVSVLNFTEP